MSRLDVVLLLPSLAQGGAERVMANHATGLHEAGDRVRVMLTDGAATQEASLQSVLHPSIDVIAIGEPRVRSALPKLLRSLRDDPPDMVIATHTHLNLALCALRGRLPRDTGLVLREPTHAPVVLDGRSTRGRRLAQRVLYRRADVVIATSRVMEQDLRRLTGAKVVMVRNPVRVEAIRSAVARAPIPPPVTGRRFVTVGRLDRQKSLPDLLRAFSSGSGPDDELVIVGDGPARAEVNALARDLGIADRVRLRGFVAEPWNEISSSDAFVLASRAEGMPNAVLEALAVGTPVIATDDLDVLHDLRDAAPPGAITLVQRTLLFEAVARVESRHRDASSGLSPCLLPEEYGVSVSTSAFRDVLLEHRRGQVSRAGT